MPSDKLYFKCICKKELELKEPMQTVCPECRRTYWKFTDDKGKIFTRLVWCPDEEQLEKEFDTNIPVSNKDIIEKILNRKME